MGRGLGNVEILVDFKDPYFLLVGGLDHFLCSIIYEIILPIDFHIFQRG